MGRLLLRRNLAALSGEVGSCLVFRRFHGICSTTHSCRIRAGAKSRTFERAEDSEATASSKRARGSYWIRGIAEPPLAGGEHIPCERYTHRTAFSSFVAIAPSVLQKPETEAVCSFNYTALGCIVAAGFGRPIWSDTWSDMRKKLLADGQTQLKTSKLPEASSPPEHQQTSAEGCRRFGIEIMQFLPHLSVVVGTRRPCCHRPHLQEALFGG